MPSVIIYGYLHAHMVNGRPLDSMGCYIIFGSKQTAKDHADEQTRPRFPCPHAKKPGCEKTFSSKGDANLPAMRAHDKVKWAFPLEDENGCTETFFSKHAAETHAKRIHGDKGTSSSGLPSPRTKYLRCEKTFATSQGADRHVEDVHDRVKPLAKKQGCEMRFTDQSNAKRHLTTVHGNTKKRKTHCTSLVCLYTFWFEVNVLSYMISFHAWT